MSGSIPFDPIADVQIDSALRLASVDAIARNLYERAVKAESAAHAAKERARTSQDLVVVAAGAETAAQAAAWCARLASAVEYLLGSGDVETVRRARALASASMKFANHAAVKWELLRRMSTRGVTPHA